MDLFYLISKRREEMKIGKKLFMRLIFMALFLIVVSGLLVAGGTQEGKSEGTGDEKAETVFRWASKTECTNWDPHATNVSAHQAFQLQVMDLLVDYTAELKLRPMLAKSWKALDDTTWEVKLREGVTFHDGSPFTADDVVFSLKRAKDPLSEMKSSYAFTDVIKIDDYTVHILTDGPNPTLIPSLTNAVMVSKKWYEEHGIVDLPDYKSGLESYAVTHAMGTGSFMLESVEPGVKTVFVKNPNWWALDVYPELNHNLDRVVYTPITNDATRVAALLAGEVDFVLDPPIQDLARIDNDPDLKLMQVPELRTLFFAMNQKRDELLSSNIKGKNPFKDVRVRRAMYLAMDHEAIHKAVMEELSFPANIPIPPGINGYARDLDNAIPEVNISRAKALLAEAGYPNGFEVTLDTPNDRYINDEKISQAYVGMLAKIGIKVNLDSQSKALHFPKITGRTTDFYLLGWGYSVLDVINFFQSIMLPDSPWNGSDIDIPEITDKIGRIQRELDNDARDRMIREVMESIVNDQLFLPIHHQIVVSGMRNNVTFVLMPNMLFRFADVRMK